MGKCLNDGSHLKHTRPRQWPAATALATHLALTALIATPALPQSSLGDGGLSGATDALKGFIERQQQEPGQGQDTYTPAPTPEYDAPSTSRGYYPDAGAGSVRDQIRRSQGAYDSVYGADGSLNCGPGCTQEGTYCHCPNPADVGGARSSQQSGTSPYEGGGVTPGDVVGDPGWDGSGGLPEGN